MNSRRLSVESTSPTVWIVGSGRLHLRIPLMQLLRERGFRMAAVGPEENSHFEGTGFDYHRYRLTRALNPFADRQAKSQLCQLFRRHRPDVVHAVNTKPCYLVPAAARRAGVSACVRTITGIGAVFSSSSPMSLALRPAYHFLQRRASADSAMTVFQNPDDRDYFLSQGLLTPGRDALVLSSGIDVEGYRRQRSGEEALTALREKLNLVGKRVVTMIGRPIRPKGIEEYLRAAAAVRQRHPDVVFLLIGSAVTTGPLAIPMSRIHRSAADVRHLNNRNDIPDILAVSDLFVLPSYFREGVPRVLLEAGAMGLPLITTDAPGCRETVRDGWNGLLVPPRDWRAVADAVLKLHKSPMLRQTMGQNSKLLMHEKFDLVKVADAYAEIYRRVLDSAVSRSGAKRRAA